MPATIRRAEDTLVCLDLANGAMLWKTALPGEPLGRRASATPSVDGGKVFAVGSARVWCLDAASGKTLWETPLTSERGINASPLVVDGAVIVNADALIAYEAATGLERWRRSEAGGTNSSPVAWTADGRTLVIVNGRNALSALDPRTGEIVWTAPGGGPSTPAILGDILAVQTKTDLGFVAYRLTAQGATKLWSRPNGAWRLRSSPLIHEGAVYLMDNYVHECFDLATGALRWHEPAASEITSPILADGKIFVLTGMGSTLLAIKATAQERLVLGKATVRAQWVPSPCLIDGRLILRMPNSIKCWSLLP